MSRKLLIAFPLLGILLLLSACGGSGSGAGLEPSERTIYMAAIEPKGSASVADEPFPAAALPEGGGYALEEPNEEGEWEVETYRWLPSEITVVEGDTVTLEILGVNGSSHTAFIEGYDVAFEVKRGELTNVEFTADQPGVFQIVCETHQPAMTASLVVLPA